MKRVRKIKVDQMEAKNKVDIIEDALNDKKASNINMLDVSGKTTICDFFVIASGSSRNQIEALSDNVQEKLFEAGVTLKNREGRADGGWILLDYDDVIVHIFTEEMREFYDLDHTWRDSVAYERKN
jgi:ribosome-associated protein